MTYYLTAGGIGIAKEREPIEDKGTVIFTFKNKKVDSVCVGGRFYPVKGQTAEIPTEGLSGSIPVSAYLLGEKTRYVCDSLLFIGERPRLLLAQTEPQGEQLYQLAEAQATLDERLTALEAATASLRESLYPTPFSFGGTK